MHSDQNFKFHPDLDLWTFSLKIFPKYYQEISWRWSKYLSLPPSFPLSIASQFLWPNKDVQIYNKCVIFSNFSKNRIYFVVVGQFSDKDGELHCWKLLKAKYILRENIKFKWFQLTHAFSKEWKEAISIHDWSIEILVIQDHHLIKLDSNKLYKLQIILKYEKPTSQSYFEKIFGNSNWDRKRFILFPVLLQ